ncbi:pyruvate kinase [Flagellimonas allohymeniacidonis]|uniref:pyruvate kinase n=1 Tax=Flagellimonas allohymeniacidonis TaxID=2517819 RepID=A0A4Q8QEH3_9FLAO|nr:pyruvate kinase [Allomuricauda hymeniacidonis]TAI48027.1 hypothetical protein EW142_15365 [Allomuricauda hymeniacidonis]
MNLSPHQLQETALLIDKIVLEIEQGQGTYKPLLAGVCEYYQKSAYNLLDYKTFRTFDVRALQEKLKTLGLTRLANAEGNILGSLLNVREVIGRLNGEITPTEKNVGLSIGDGNRLLRENTQKLFSVNGDRRRVRIMVTQPTEAAHDYQMVHEMVQNGMDCARINCAHDGPEVWESIVRNVRKAAAACSREVKIAMDLGGPKIRTGSVPLGPEVRKFRPKRDFLGNVVGPALIRMVPEKKETLESDEIPVAQDWLQYLVEGETLIVKDTRGKQRKLKVFKIEENSTLLSCKKTVYIATGTQINPKRKELPKVAVGKLSAREQSIELYIGDTLTISMHLDSASLPEFDSENNLNKPGRIACIPAEIIQKVKPGELIFFDDGKIEGIIEKVSEDFFEVRITKANAKGSKLKSEKGINLPQSNLGISGLTEKDRQDLAFVATHADIVNFSFVNSAADVHDLLSELERLNALDKLSIILKIETQKAFVNLVDIVLAAMKTKYIGIMIARGDLALEVGWRNMSKVQDEILSLCGAAHIPVVWATQVLEGLAKKGFPSRSEITDTTSSLRAECVMLNKGPYIGEAIAFLNELLQNMENLHEKKEGMWPKIDWM